MKSLLLIKCVSLGCVICFSWNMTCNNYLCRYFTDSVGIKIGMFLACTIYCVYSGVGMRGNALNVFLRWIPLVVLSRNRVLEVGERVQS